MWLNILVLQQHHVDGQGCKFYWATVELVISMVDVARKFDLPPAAVSYAAQRGEKMTKERDYQLET